MFSTARPPNVYYVAPGVDALKLSMGARSEHSRARNREGNLRLSGEAEPLVRRLFPGGSSGPGKFIAAHNPSTPSTMKGCYKYVRLETSGSLCRILLAAAQPGELACSCQFLMFSCWCFHFRVGLERNTTIDCLQTGKYSVVRSSFFFESGAGISGNCRGSKRPRRTVAAQERVLHTQDSPRFE